MVSKQEGVSRKERPRGSKERERERTKEKRLRGIRKRRKRRIKDRSERRGWRLRASQIRENERVVKRIKIKAPLLIHMAPKSSLRMF